MITQILYNVFLFPLLLLAAPKWWQTMKKRGGVGSGLLERLSIYSRPANEEWQGPVYVHAVSVGEVLLAGKLIAAWREKSPEDHFLLLPTTATGHQVAQQFAAEDVRIIYSPVDLLSVTSRVLSRFKPKVIVLIESEIWPNLTWLARRRQIPVAIANARLSPRSARRYAKLRLLALPVLRRISCICVPTEREIVSWREIGISPEVLRVTGNLKLDTETAQLPEKRPEFSNLIDAFGQGRKIVLGVSTFAGEEVMIANAVRELGPEWLAVIAPRHAERRAEVVEDLEGEGFDPVLRSEGGGKGDCLVIDSTGELRDWTAHADIAVIGKSWSAEGGQSPVEAILAGVPVICGPEMGNFQSLMDDLTAADGVTQLESGRELVGNLKRLATDQGTEQAERAKSVLQNHKGAAGRMVTEILSL